MKPYNPSATEKRKNLTDLQIAGMIIYEPHNSVKQPYYLTVDELYAKISANAEVEKERLEPVLKCLRKEGLIGSQEHFELEDGFPNGRKTTRVEWGWIIRAPKEQGGNPYGQY